MAMSSMVISIIFTIVILLLSILTISKGYGYKHKVDPEIDPIREDYEQKEDSQISQFK